MARRSIPKIAGMILQTFRQLSPIPDAESFSGRECEVLQLAAKGLTRQEIADELKLSPHSVTEYIKRSFDKLHVRNLPAAVSEAIRRGFSIFLIEPAPRCRRVPNLRDMTGIPVLGIVSPSRGEVPGFKRILKEQDGPRGVAARFVSRDLRDLDRVWNGSSVGADSKLIFGRQSLCLSQRHDPSRDASFERGAT